MKLLISDKKCTEIQIVTSEDEIIAIITDEEVIAKKGYKVICVPIEN